MSLAWCRPAKCSLLATVDADVQCNLGRAVSTSVNITNLIDLMSQQHAVYRCWEYNTEWSPSTTNAALPPNNAATKSDAKTQSCKYAQMTLLALPSKLLSQRRLHQDGGLSHTRAVV